MKKMVIASLEEKIEEFMNLGSEYKFLKKTISFFKDGNCANSWFHKHKEEIEKSNDPRCKEIIRQYNQSLKEREEYSLRNKELFHNTIISKTAIIKEFMHIEDESKFSKDCTITLSNGLNAYIWFEKNIDYVLTVSDSNFLEIKKQYLNYKRKINSKSSLTFKKDCLSFIKENGFVKFTSKNEFLLPSGINAYKWFGENLEYFKESASPYDVEIMNQFNEWLDYKNIAYEFYSDKDDKKFETSSWWETYKKSILTSELFLDQCIKKQYEEYLKLNGDEEIKFVDEELMSKKKEM